MNNLRQINNNTLIDKEAQQPIGNLIPKIGKIKKFINSENFVPKENPLDKNKNSSINKFVDSLRNGSGRSWQANKNKLEINPNDSILNLTFSGDPITDNTKGLGFQKTQIAITKNNLKTTDASKPPDALLSSAVIDFYENNQDFNSIDNHNDKIKVINEKIIFGGDNKPQSKKFFDFPFEISIPFSKREIKHFDIGNCSVIEFNPIYNFFAENYESRINDSSIQEYLLPNLYLLGTEKLNTFSDEFVMAISKLKEGKVPKDISVYYDKYSKGLGSYISVRDQIVENKLSVEIFPTRTIHELQKLNEKKFLFPMHVQVKFQTDNLGQFTQILEDSNLSVPLLQTIIDKKLPSKLNTFQENVTTIIETKNDVKNDLHIQGTSLPTWDLLEWLQNVNLNNFLPNEDSIILGDFENDLKAANSPNFEIYKNLLIIIFIGKLKTLIKNNIRSYEDIVNGKLASSETLFYKIEKFDSNDKLLQTFYFSNSNKISEIDFIDTQVKYNKKYVYKIFAYQIVLGNFYIYEVNEFIKDKVIINNKNEPILKLIEVPFFQYETTVLDSPPMAPDINFIPYKGINNKILINLNNSIGSAHLEPIAIEQIDSKEIDSLKLSQETDKLLYFNSDDLAAAFEIYRMNVKPNKIDDFAGNKLVTIYSDVNLTTIQKASSASFIDTLIPNKKYYYVFRVIDNHSHFSNPTLIYEVELIDDNGVVYANIQVVDFNQEMNTYTKTVKNIIQIRPAFEQKLINEEKSNLISDGIPVKTVLDKDDIHLGLSDEVVWGKKFKIRLTSKKTSKKIDINVSFVHNHTKDI